MNKTYAGIGSRETPYKVIETMQATSKFLSKYGYSLYSGGAEGADEAFEKGATNKTIWLPWDGFNGKFENGLDYVVPEEAKEFVSKYHPNPKRLSEKAFMLMSRNAYQVLGPDLKSPVEFVLCWTKNGKASGGTGQAMRIAKDYNIPIYNFKTDSRLIETLLRGIRWENGKI